MPALLRRIDPMMRYQLSLSNKVRPEISGDRGSLPLHVPSHLPFYVPLHLLLHLPLRVPLHLPLQVKLIDTLKEVKLQEPDTSFLAPEVSPSCNHRL